VIKRNKVKKKKLLPKTKKKRSLNLLSYLVLAEITASSDVFGFSKNVGCCFHFGQCLLRKIRNIKLWHLYNNNQKVIIILEFIKLGIS
jgi:hypothetical protein